MRKFALLVAAVAVVAVGVAAIPSAARVTAKTPKAKLQVRKTSLGTIIVDQKGRTLYLFEKDKGKTSACYSACAAGWPPLLTSGKPTVAKGVTASKVGTTKRKNGVLQVTYAGHPLYHFIGDKKPGQTTGEGSKAFGASWYVVAPSGKKIDKS